MRNSNRFSLNLTRANVKDPGDKVEFRKSIKVKHHDVYLDPYAKHLRDAKRMLVESQNYGVRPLKDCYEEA